MTAPSPLLPRWLALRQRYQADKAQLLAPLQAPGGPAVRLLLQRLTQLVDQQLVALAAATGLPAQVAIVAVGGYGRSQLFRIRILTFCCWCRRTMPLCAQRWRLLSPPAGIRGWRSAPACAPSMKCSALAQQDITAQTSMLEMRHIGGSTEHFSQLLAQLPSTFHPQEFFLAKHLELRQRHTKFENAPYALEPNCKESPAACATCTPFCGWPKRPIWARLA